MDLVGHTFSLRPENPEILKILIKNPYFCKTFVSVIRKFFPLDKNYLLKEAQLTLQDHLLSSLVEKTKAQYEYLHNPLGLDDSFSLKIKTHQVRNLKPLDGFYQTLAGLYRFRFGDNQLEFLWDGQSHFEKYQRDWAAAFEQWNEEFRHREQFVQAVLDLSVFLPENRHAHLAENRMNFVMLDFFSQQDGFPELKVKKGGVVELRVA